MIKNLTEVADYFQSKLEKVASYPSVEQLTSIIKGIVKNLISSNPDVMDGVLYASNVHLQPKIESINVSFLLNIDREKVRLIGHKDAERKALVINSIKNTLENKYQQYQWNIRFGEFPTDPPKWFEDEAQ